MINTNKSIHENINENHISIMSLSVSIRNLKFKVEKLITSLISTNSANMINERNI